MERFYRTRTEAAQAAQAALKGKARMGSHFLPAEGLDFECEHHDEGWWWHETTPDLPALSAESVASRAVEALDALLQQGILDAPVGPEDREATEARSRAKRLVRMAQRLGMR